MYLAPISESERLVSELAARILPGLHPVSEHVSIGAVERAVEYAERIVREVQRHELDSVDDRGPELPPGVLHVDEFSSQFPEGTHRTAGIHIEWRRGPEIGPSDNTLSGEEVEQLKARVITALEDFVAGRSDLQILHDDPSPLDWP